MRNVEFTEIFEHPQEPLEFATLDHGFEYYRDKGLKFVEGCDDLDMYMASYFELDSGKRLMLIARHTHPNYADRIGLVAPANDSNPIESMDEFLAGIGKDRKIVQWLSPFLTNEERWVLVRRGDHGNRLVVGHFWDKGEAEGALDYYARKHPKQEFWLEIAQPIPCR